MPNAANPGWVAYRTWGRALAERWSDDGDNNISTRKRDSRLQKEYNTLKAQKTLQAHREDVKKLEQFAGLPNDAERLADPEARQRLYPNYTELWTELKSISNDATEYQDLWAQIAARLDNVDKKWPPQGLQSSAILAKIRHENAVSEQMQNCIAALRRIESGAPRAGFFTTEEPSHEDMLDEFDEAGRDKKWLEEIKPFPNKDANLVGQGTFGTVRAFSTADESNRLVDRVAVKEVILSTRDQKREETWQGGDKQSRIRLAEAWLHSLTSGRHFGDNNIVGYGNWTQVVPSKKKKERDDFTAKIYMAFCPKGSLRGLVKEYEDEVRLQETPAQKMAAMFPENFLWSAFHSLVTAACIMKHGRKPGYGESWTSEVVHFDIKPDNVSLTDPRTNGKYPKCLNLELGDFGIAADIEESWLDEKGNPEIFIGGGTFAWTAPELKGYGESGNEPSHHADRLESRTDVFAIGLVMMGMMNLTSMKSFDLEDHDDDDHFPPLRGFSYMAAEDNPYGHELKTKPGEPEFLVWARAKYSQQLRFLLLKCLDPNPAARPEVDDLYREICKHVRDPAFNKEKPGTSIEAGGVQSMAVPDEGIFALPPNDGDEGDDGSEEDDAEMDVSSDSG